MSLIEYNPAKTVKAPKKCRAIADTCYLELEQLEKLFQLTAKDSPKFKRDRLILALMALQGKSYLLNCL